MIRHSINTALSSPAFESQGEALLRHEILSAARTLIDQVPGQATFDGIAALARTAPEVVADMFTNRKGISAALEREDDDRLVQMAAGLANYPRSFLALAIWLRALVGKEADILLWRRWAEDFCDDRADSHAHHDASIRPAFDGLFRRALEEGAVRQDITAAHVLEMVRCLPRGALSGIPDYPYLEVLLDGLRVPL